MKEVDRVLTPLRDEKWKIFKGRQLLISGPCSAETRSQVMNTARQLAACEEGGCFYRRYLEAEDET